MPKDKSEKEKHSIFMITINTNKALDKNMTDKFARSLVYLFSKPKVYEYIVEKRPGEIFKESKISKYTFKLGSIEIGKKFKKVHVHIMLKIDHYMFIGLNQKKIRDFYYNMFGTKIHLDIKARGNELKSWSDYMFKDSVDNPTSIPKVKEYDEDEDKKKD
jgi:hypothetical protein